MSHGKAAVDLFAPLSQGGVQLDLTRLLMEKTITVEEAVLLLQALSQPPRSSSANQSAVAQAAPSSNEGAKTAPTGQRNEKKKKLGVVELKGGRKIRQKQEESQSDFHARIREAKEGAKAATKERIEKELAVAKGKRESKKAHSVAVHEARAVKSEKKKETNVQRSRTLVSSFLERTADASNGVLFVKNDKLDLTHAALKTLRLKVERGWVQHQPPSSAFETKLSDIRAELGKMQDRLGKSMLHSYQARQRKLVVDLTDIRAKLSFLSFLEPAQSQLPSIKFDIASLESDVRDNKDPAEAKKALQLKIKQRDDYEVMKKRYATLMEGTVSLSPSEITKTAHKVAKGVLDEYISNLPVWLTSKGRA